MPSSRGSSRPRDQTRVPYVSCFGRRVPYPRKPGPPADPQMAESPDRREQLHVHPWLLGVTVLALLVAALLIGPEQEKAEAQRTLVTGPGSRR